MTLQLVIINAEQIPHGNTAIVQVNGDAAETLPPGQQLTVFIDDDAACMISVETNGNPI